MAAWLIALHSAHAPWPRVQLLPWLGRTRTWSPTVLTARYSALLTANHETPSMVEQWTEPYPAQSPDPSIFEEPSDEYPYPTSATVVAEKKRGAPYPSHILARLVQQRDYVAAERVLDELKALNLPIRKSFVYKHAVIHAITRRDLTSQWDRLEHVAKWLRLFPHAIPPRRLTRSSFAWNRLHPVLKARSTSRVTKWYYRTASSGTYYSSRPGHFGSNNWQLNHFRSVLQAVTSSHPIPDIPLLIQFHLITASKGYDFSSRIIPIIATYAPLDILYTYLRQLRSVALKFNGSKKFKGEEKEKGRVRGRQMNVRTKAKRVMERWWKIAVYSLVRHVSLRKAKEVWKVATRRFKYDVPDYREILAKREKAMRRDVNTRFQLSRKISALRSAKSGETYAYEGLLRTLHRTFDQNHILPVKTLFDIMQLSPPLSVSLSPSSSTSSTSPHITDTSPSPSTLPTTQTLSSLRTKFYSPTHPSTRAARIANWALAQMLYHISRGEDTAALLVFLHHFYAVGVPKCVAGLAMREVVLRSGSGLGSYVGAGERMMNERNEGVVKMTPAEFLRTLPSLYLSLSPSPSQSLSQSQSQSQPHSQSHSQPQSHTHKLIPDASHTSLVYKIVLRATKTVEEVEEVYKEFLGYLNLVQERDWSAGGKGGSASGKGGSGSRGRGAGMKLVQEAYEAFENAGWRDISSSSLSVSSPSSLPPPSPSNSITSPSPSPSHHQPPSHSPSQTQSEKPYPHPTPASTQFDMAHFTHFVYAFARRSSTLDRARQVLNKDMGRYGMGVKLKVEGAKKKKEEDVKEEKEQDGKGMGKVEEEDIRAWTALVSVGVARFGVKPLQKELEGLLSRLERNLDLCLQERSRRLGPSPVLANQVEEGSSGVAAVGGVGTSEVQGQATVQGRAQQDRPLSLPKALLITYTAIIRFLTTSNRLDDALRIAERLRDRVGYSFPSPTPTSIPNSPALDSSPPPSTPTPSTLPASAHSSASPISTPSSPSSSSTHADASPSPASSFPPSSASKSTSAQNDILDAENTDIYDDAHFDIYVASEGIEMYEDDESTNNIDSTSRAIHGDSASTITGDPLSPSVVAATEQKTAQNEKTQMRWKRDEITDWVLQDLMRKLAQRDRDVWHEVSVSAQGSRAR